MTARTAETTAQKLVAARKAALAERRIIRTARQWFATFTRNSIEAECLRAYWRNQLILALGLDMEARNELRAAKRRNKR